MKTKYIIIDDNRMSIVPILFTENMSHADMVECMKSRMPRLEVVSAGFVEFSPNGLMAYGESVSLGIKSRGKDSELLNRYMWGNQC